RRLHQFNGLHSAQAANIADDGPALLPFASAFLELTSQFVGSRQQVFMLEDVEHGQSGGAGQRIACECAAQTTGARSIHDFCAARDAGQRQSTSERLGGYENIRLDAVILAGEQSSRASEAA